MGRKNSNAMNQILDYYRMYDLDVESVYQVTKLVLAGLQLTGQIC